MTMVPVKNRLERTMNLPKTLPAKLIKILLRGEDERSWNDVLELQKATWKIPDSKSREIIDEAVQKSYQLRYGDKPVRLDATGRPIDEEKEWSPKKRDDSDKIARVGIKLRQVAEKTSREDAFRGLEYAFNLLRGINDKAVKVCGDFDVSAQNLFDKILQKNSSAEILKAFKTGLISDCIIGYPNRELSAEEKKKRVVTLLDIFKQNDEPDKDDAQDKPEDESGAEEEETAPEFNKESEGDKALSDDIKGFVWISQDGCAECQGYNGQFFTPDEVPSGHPNCRCSIEVVLKGEEEEGDMEKNDKKASERKEIDYDKLSKEEQKKINHEIYKRNLKDLEKFEGKVPYIYLDTEGNMTTGTGTNIEDKAVFVKVKFEDENGRELSVAEKEALYDKIQEQKAQINEFKSKSARYYKGKWNAKVSDEERQRLVEEHVDKDLVGLRKMCMERGKNFDELPKSQQDVLLDMRYNMGSIREEKWTNFYEGFDIDDYDKMAKESHRKEPISDERNDWTRDKFKAAKIEAQKKK